MSEKSIYRQWTGAQRELPIFLQDWWLDAVCVGGRWEVISVRDKSGDMVAAMPFFEKRRYGFTIVTMPPLTPALGPWYRDGWRPDLGQEHRLLKQLLEGLPARPYIRQKWMPQRTNWLPAYWLGYHQCSYYQHIVPDLPDWAVVEQGFAPDVRRRMRKAAAALEVGPSSDLAAFYRLLTATFQRQALPPPVSFAFLQRLYAVLDQRNRVALWCACDRAGNWHAAQFLVWDAHYLYSLAAATDPLLRSSGAHQLLVGTILRELRHLAPAFNFVGSMAPGIARMNESFGARPTPYSVMVKTWLPGAGGR